MGRQRRTKKPHSRRRGLPPHLPLSWGREIEAPQTRVREGQPRLLLPSWGERDVIAQMRRMRSPQKGAPSPEAGRERSLPGGAKDPMKGLEGGAEKKDQKKGAPEEKDQMREAPEGIGQLREVLAGERNQRRK